MPTVDSALQRTATSNLTHSIHQRECTTTGQRAAHEPRLLHQRYHHSGLTSKMTQVATSKKSIQDFPLWPLKGQKQFAGKLARHPRLFKMPRAVVTLGRLRSEHSLSYLFDREDAFVKLKVAFIDQSVNT